MELQRCQEPKLYVPDTFLTPLPPDRANDHYALDVTRARELLDWTPRRSLRETIPKMVEFLKADPVQFYEENKLDPPASVHARVRVHPRGGVRCKLNTRDMR